MRLKISLRKILSVIATSAVIFNSLAPTMTVLAQTVEPTPTPTDIASPTPDPTVIPTDSATPTVTPDATPVDLTTPTPDVTPTATDLVTPLPSDQPIVTQSPESNPTVQGPPSSDQPTITPTITPTATPSTPTEQGTLTETTINNIDLSGVTGLNGSISTNQADYSPTSLVLISGSGFLANKEYTINIVSTDQPPVNFTDQVKADSSGNISYAYQLDGNYRPNYSVYIKSGEVIAGMTSFTDSGNTNSGDGSISVTPTSVIINSTGNTLTFTFVGRNSKTFPTGSDIAIQIPSDWSTPQTSNPLNPGYVGNQANVTGSSCNPGVPSILGNIITISQTCNNTDSFKFNYSNASAPNTVETSTFNTTSRSGSSGTEQPLSSQPTVVVGIITLPGGNPAANLEQCHNESGGSYTDCKDPSSPTNTWGSGNAGSGNAKLFEGNSQNYRLILSNMAVGVPQTITIGQQYTKGGKMAYDFPTGPGNLGTATTPIGLAGIFPCDDNSGGLLVSPCDHQVPSLTTAGKLPISAIPGGTIPDATVGAETISAQSAYYGTSETTAPTRSPNNMYIYGATPGSFGGYTFVGTAAQVASGDTDLNWSFTITPTSSTVVVAWGAHISMSGDYGTKGTAVTISGSPYHTVLVSASFGNVGNQDMQMAAGAIIPFSTITINKTAVGGNATFGYTSSTTGGSNLPASFNITTTLGSGSVSYNTITPGTYTITESALSGWGLTGLTCSSSGTGTSASTNLGTGVVNITIGSAGGGNVSCTYTNSLQNGTLTVQKTTIPALDPTIFSINATGSGTITGGGAGTVTDSTDKVYTVTAGTYSVSETVPTGWSQTGNTCSGVVVAAGGSASCLITNSKLPKLTVTKTLVPSNDPGVFNLKIDGTTDAANVGNTGTTGAQTLTIGGHTVSETAGTGTDLSNYTAVIGGDCAANGSITLAAGDNKTCTITNTRNTGTIELKKIWSGTAGQTTLNIGTSAGGSQVDTQLTGTNGGAPLTTGANTVNTGTYYLSESGGLTNYSSVLGCTDNSSPITPGTDNSVIVATGHAIVCTFTNTRNQGTIELKKIWSGTAGQTTLDIGTTAGGTNVASVQTGANGNTPLTTGAKTVDTGTYYVSESGGLTNYSSVLGCTDNGQTVTPGTDNSLSVTTGHAVVCTYTNTRNTGTITIIKTALGGDGTFGYTITGDTPLTPSFTTSGGTYTWGPTTVDTGSSYTVTETTLPAGWLTTSQSCSKDGGKTTFNGGVAFSINTGDNVVCSFTNTKLGTIIVKKVMVGGTDSFTFTGDVAGTISTSGGTLSSSNKMPKSFTSTEGTVTGWNLTSIACDDTRSTTPSTGNLDTRTATFNVDPGETVTCTFTNTKIPTLTVEKVLSPTNDPGVFNLLINGQTYANDVGNGGSTGTQYAVIGSNTVGETAGTNTVLSDYTAVIGGDCAANGTITLAAGDNKTCTITNTRNTGAIKVNKFLDASGNGTFAPANPGIFTWSLDGSGTNAMGGTVSGINTGPHNVGESSVTDYHFVGWYLGNPIDNQFSCSNLPETSSTALPISVTVTNGGVAQINLCNVRDTGTITVNKVVNPSEGDNGLFDLQIDGSTAGTGNDVGNGGTTGAITVVTGSHYVGEVAGTETKLADYTSSISCDNDQSGQGTILRGIDVSAGENVVCTITNTRLNPQISIVKSNNAGGGIGAGSTVTYTLTITNSGDVNFDNVAVTDLLPGGFTYVDGSTTGATFVPPQIGSKLTWNLGTLAAGAIATITYQAQTDSSLSAGNYQNFATCTATYNDGETQPCNQTNSTVTIGAGTNYGGNLVGQVLGASTELPGTGSPTALLIMALGLLGTGLFLGYNSKKGAKKHAKN